MIDNSNVQDIITSFEVKDISESIHDVDISGVKSDFSPDVQREWESIQTTRPTGQIDLLIGVNVFGLHHVDFELHRILRIKVSKF